MKVKEIKNRITVKPPVVKEDASIKDVVNKLLEDPRSRSVYVVDDNGVLKGIIPTDVILKATHLLKGKRTVDDEDTFEDITISTARIARDLMHSPVYVHEDDDVLDVLEAMVEEGFQELPVVNRENKVTGDLNCLEIISALWEGETNNK